MIQHGFILFLHLEDGHFVNKYTVFLTFIIIAFILWFQFLISEGYHSRVNHIFCCQIKTASIMVEVIVCCLEEGSCEVLHVRIDSRFWWFNLWLLLGYILMGLSI